MSSEIREDCEASSTHCGKPSDALARTPPPAGRKPSLRTLRGAFAGVLPDATYQDFLEIKALWRPRELE